MFSADFCDAAYCISSLLVICGQDPARNQKGDRGPDPLLQNHIKIRILSNTGPDPLEIHKATKPAFNE